jgi:tRNA-splicing ligase RtcB (3'-phosphate/5'-hydroxy nucleic acid ligase)
VVSATKEYIVPHSEWSDKVKAWVDGVHLDENTRTQVLITASLPEVVAVAVMPDAHVGLGSTVGSVVVTKKVLLPACAGVDLGCGMNAVRTSLTATDLPDSLSVIRNDLERAIPFGRTNNGGAGDRGAWATPPASVTSAWRTHLEDRFNKIVEKAPKIGHHNSITHLGSGGSGNHFLEVCLDEEDRVWVMLHSGSRGVGNRIAQFYINKAKEEMTKRHRGLPNEDLSFLERGTEVFDDYVEGMLWAQDFALVSRRLMLDRALKVLRDNPKIPSFTTAKVAVECHHNYVAFENHFGEEVIITRKGAVNAEKGRLGIIPGSMGTGSFIVEGLGNPDSYNSCSHGAGRVMSRTQAKKMITMEDHAKAMEGIEYRRDDPSLLDESPAAYKDLAAVIEAQTDLIQIKHRLRQIVNVKG